MDLSCIYEDLINDLIDDKKFKPVDVLIEYIYESKDLDNLRNIFLVVSQRNAFRWIDETFALEILKNDNYRNQMTLVYNLILNHLEFFRLKCKINLNGDTWFNNKSKIKDDSLKRFLDFIEKYVIKSILSWKNLLNSKNIEEYGMFMLGIKNLLYTYGVEDTGKDQNLIDMMKLSYDKKNILKQKFYSDFFDVIINENFEDIENIEYYYASETIFDTLISEYILMINMGEMQFYKDYKINVTKNLPRHNAQNI